MSQFGSLIATSPSRVNEPVATRGEISPKFHLSKGTVAVLLLD